MPRRQKKELLAGTGQAALTVSAASWEEYNETFKTIPRSTLLQSPLYASTASGLYAQRGRPFFIKRGGKAVGACLIMEAAALGGVLHALILDRGPLWIADPPCAQDIKEFFLWLGSTYPVRPGRRRRIIPELEVSELYRQALAQARMKRLERPGYQTGWLDLLPDPEELRAGLHGKWRNSLRKAEKSPLEYSWSDKYGAAAFVIAAHHKERQVKNYRGASLKTLAALCCNAAEEKALFTGTARLGGVFVSGVILIRHGRSATYQVGWNAPAGRAYNANYALLWQGLTALRGAGVAELDLGGFHEEETSGIARFKNGLGGKKSTLLGQYK